MSEPDRRRATLFVTGHKSDLTFRRDSTAALDHYPCPLDAGDLRTAAMLTRRLEPDIHGALPLPLLRIHAPSDTFPPELIASRIRPDRRSILFARAPGLLAGLIADAVRAGVASGAILRVCDDPADTRQEIAAHLRDAGFQIAFNVPGWTSLAVRLDNKRAKRHTAA